MLHGDPVAPQGVWQAAEARRRYASQDPEERYYRRHVSARQAATSLMLWPLMNIEKGFLYYTHQSDPITGMTQKVVKKDNLWITGYRQLNMLAVKSWGSEYTRAFVDGYNTDQDYRVITGAAADLRGLIAAAGAIAPESPATSPPEAAATALTQLFNQGDMANEALREFIQGHGATTPSRAQKLYDTLIGLEALFEAAARELPTLAQRADASRVSSVRLLDPYGSLLAMPQVESVEDARRGLAIISALLMESAKPMGTMYYVEKSGFDLEEPHLRAIVRFVHDEMTRRNLSLNQNYLGTRLLDSLPPGAIIRLSGQPPRASALSEREIIDFTQALLQFVAKTCGKDVSRIGAHVKDYLEEISAATGAAEPLESAFLGRLDGSAVQPGNEQPRTVGTPAATNLAPPAATSVGQHMSALARYVTRPEMSHESQKLYARKFANYALNMPLSIISNMLLGFTKKDAAQNPLPLNMEQWKKHGMSLLFTGDNLKASLYMLAVYPFVESFAINSIISAAGYKKQLTHDKMQDANRLLDASVEAMGNLFPDFSARMHAAARGCTLETLLQEKPGLRETLAKARYLDQPLRDPKESAEAYHALAEFFHESASHVLEHASATLFPLLATNMGRPLPLGERIRHALLNEVKTAEDAALVLAFLHSVNVSSAWQLTTFEYIDPLIQPLDAQGLEQVNSAIVRQRDALTHNDPGAFLQAVENIRETAVPHLDKAALANLLTGEARDLCIPYMEHFLCERDGAAANLPVVQPAAGNETLQRPWQATPRGKVSGGSIADAVRHAIRPEARHEMNLLFKRQLFSEGSYLPFNISENHLWGHKLWPEGTQGAGNKLAEAAASKNVLQAFWRWASYTLTFSYGSIFLRDFGHFRQEHSRRGSVAAEEGLSGVIARTLAEVPGVSASLAGDTSFVRPLYQLGKDKQASAALPALLSVPAEKRTAEEQAYVGDFLQAYCREMGHDIGRALNGPTTHAGTASVLRKPAHDLAGALVKLALVDAIIGHDKTYIDQLRYVPPSSYVLSPKQVELLSDFCSGQVEASGLLASGKSTDPADVIRLANVVSARCYAMAEGKLTSPSVMKLLADYTKRANTLLGQATPGM